MNCPHRYIFSSTNLQVVLHMKIDYTPESSMPKREWFYFWNYELMAICRQEYNMKKYYLFRWNYDNKFGRYISSLIYKLKSNLD